MTTKSESGTVSHDEADSALDTMERYASGTGWGTADCSLRAYISQSRDRDAKLEAWFAHMKLPGKEILARADRLETALAQRDALLAALVKQREELRQQVGLRPDYVRSAWLTDLDAAIKGAGVASACPNCGGLPRLAMLGCDVCDASGKVTPSDKRDGRIERLENLERAQRIIWAWATKHEEATPPAPVFHRYMNGAQWRIPIPGTGGRFEVQSFHTPEGATLALAAALVAQDASLEALAADDAEASR
jgi:hypothetical protein